MKKLKVSLIISTVFIFISVLICSMYTATRLNYLQANPFGLSDNYREIHVISDAALEGEIREQLLNIVHDQEITIIIDNMDSLGLGVYDSQEFFVPHDTRSGNYISRQEFLSLEPVILVKENSYIHRSSIENDNIYTSGSREYQIAGTYDIQHPLSTHNHEYIYNLFLEEYMSGSLYVDTESEETFASLLALIQENSYQCYLVNSRNNGDILELFRSDRYFLAMVLGVIFSLFSVSVLLFNIFHGMKREIAICVLFGATKFKLYVGLSRKMFGNFAIGALLGACVYYLVLSRFQRLQMPVTSLLAILLFCCIALFVLFTFLFFVSKNRVKDGEWV